MRRYRSTLVRVGARETLVMLIPEFVENLLARGYSAETARTWRKQLCPFAAWCSRRGVVDPRRVSEPLLDVYQRALHLRRKVDGEPLAASTRNTAVTALRRFFRWLLERGEVRTDPAARLRRLRIGRRLPRRVLSVEEVEAVLATPDLSDAFGLRDRAILETLYSTGIRRQELARLDVADVDLCRGVILVRSGKQDRDRVVPLGARAASWIERFIRAVRPGLVHAPGGPVLFPSRRGGRIGLSALSHLVTGHVRAAHLGPRGGCHLFRHSMATLMLDNGADLRAIQEILGHASLATTQLYTHVAIAQLKRVHAATHPAERGGSGTVASEEPRTAPRWRLKNGEDCGPE